MKTHFLFLPKTLAAVALTIAGVMATPAPVDAKPNKKKNKSSSHHRHGGDRDRDRYDRDHDHDHDYNRRVFYSRPSSTFALGFGTGYAGRGYYYDPPGSSYYYNAPGVRYYASRTAVPARYLGGGYASDYGGTDAAVQRALARRGYYNGPIDGDLGSGSRRAISRYQADHALAVTGSVTSSLLRSLGL
jgi:hypothetical protein